MPVASDIYRVVRTVYDRILGDFPAKYNVFIPITIFCEKRIETVSNVKVAF